MKKQLLSLALLATSAMLKAQSPYPIIPVDSVQFVNQTRLSATGNTFPDWITPTFKDSVHRDTVRFEGVVVTNPKSYGLSANRKAAYVQRIGGGPWSGVLVMCNPAAVPAPNPTLSAFLTETKFYENFVPGKVVRVTGVISDFQGETQINLIRDNANYSNAVEQVSLNDTSIVWHEVEVKDLMLGNPVTGWVQQKQTAEQWEGTPVIIRNVTVYSIQTSGNRSFWNVIDDNGNVFDVRDMSAYYRRDDNEDTVPKIANSFQPPAIGTRLEYIRGVVTEYAASGVQRYGISPLYPEDVKICTSCPPAIKFIERSPVAAKVTDTLHFTAEATSIDTTIKKIDLVYRRPGSSTLDSVQMVAHPTMANQYIGTVNPVGTDGVLKFWFRSRDNKGRTTFYPDPLSLGRSMLVTANGVDNIRVLQYSNTNSGSTIWDGDSLLNINVKGIVTTSDAFGGYITVQDGQGPNSAILVQRSSQFGTDALRAGDSIEITRAMVRENFNVTTLFSVAFNNLGQGALPTMEMNLPLDSFINNRVAYARPYECVLMRFDSVQVISTNPDGPASDFGEFSIYSQTSTPATGLRVDDLGAGFKGLNKLVRVGTKMNYIQGPMYFANGNFKLIPRNFSDMDFSDIDTLPPVITLKGNNPDSVILNTPSYTDPGAMAMDNFDGDISDSVKVTGTVNTSIVGSYTLNYTVSDAWGNSSSLSRTVIVHDTTKVGVTQNEMQSAIVNIFPNPASDVININATGIKTFPVTMVVYDVIGREVYSKTVNTNLVNERINTAEFNNGVYFVKVSNSQGSKTIRFVVSGK